MDFLTANIGWFGGSFVIIVLAIIGYLADKNEKETELKMRQSEPKYINPQIIDNTIEQINKPQTEPIINEQPVINEQQIEDKIEETIRNAEENKTSFNDFENISMSLEDLEKKNYDNLLNKKEQNLNNVEEFIPQEYIQNNIPEIKEEKTEQPIEQQTINDIPEQPVEQQRINDIPEQPVDNKMDELIENSINTNIAEQSNETIKEPIQQEQTTNNMNYESEIPELFDNVQKESQEIEQPPIPEPVQKEINSYNSTDDDIWKF